MSLRFYNRLRGRFPELQELLYKWKIDYVERSTSEEKKELLDILGQTLLADTLECKMEQLKVTEEPTSSKESLEQRLVTIAEDMQSYMKEVEAEWDRLLPSIKDTIKSFLETLKLSTDPSLRSGMVITRVGSLDLATQYSVSKNDHCLDLVI